MSEGEPFAADGEFGAQFNQFAEAAVAMKTMYDSFVGAGFTEDQALQIALSYLDIAGRNGGSS